MSKTTPIEELANEISELGYRANKVKYKNKLPKLPKNPTDATMSGYYKRLRNWSNGLFSLEIETNRDSSKVVKANFSLLETSSK